MIDFTGADGTRWRRPFRKAPRATYENVFGLMVAYRTLAEQLLAGNTPHSVKQNLLAALEALNSAHQKAARQEADKVGAAYETTMADVFEAGYYTLKAMEDLALEFRQAYAPAVAAAKRVTAANDKRSVTQKKNQQPRRR